VTNARDILARVIGSNLMIWRILLASPQELSESAEPRPLTELENETIVGVSHSRTSEEEATTPWN